ncbi:MAG: ribosome assembly RNA-binding protein YhbY [Clostridiales bacterium]|nr:ribosome assembly RNA-binding protein YhbY [Clostridiales bacterium]
MLTGKQRSYLRKLANSESSLFQIGKGGISASVVKQIEEALEAKELIKVHLLDNSDLSPKEACDTLAQETGADSVQVVGSKFVLYKKSRENPRIQLP